MDNGDLETRFTYHPPTPERHDNHDRIRIACKSLAAFLHREVPEGREKALAITNLEQVMFWANAGIARQE